MSAYVRNERVCRESRHAWSIPKIVKIENAFYWGGVPELRLGHARQ